MTYDRASERAQIVRVIRGLIVSLTERKADAPGRPRAGVQDARVFPLDSVCESVCYRNWAAGSWSSGGEKRKDQCSAIPSVKQADPERRNE